MAGKPRRFLDPSLIRPCFPVDASVVERGNWLNYVSELEMGSGTWFGG